MNISTIVNMRERGCGDIAIRCIDTWTSPYISRFEIAQRSLDVIQNSRLRLHPVRDHHRGSGPVGLEAIRIGCLVSLVSIGDPRRFWKFTSIRHRVEWDDHGAFFGTEPREGIERQPIAHRRISRHEKHPPLSQVPGATFPPSQFRG